MPNFFSSLLPILPRSKNWSRKCGQENPKKSTCKFAKVTSSRRSFEGIICMMQAFLFMPFKHPVESLDFGVWQGRNIRGRILILFSPGLWSWSSCPRSEVTFPEAILVIGTRKTNRAVQKILFYSHLLSIVSRRRPHLAENVPQVFFVKICQKSIMQDSLWIIQ